MRIFPAVDILGGRCVQLVQGKRESATAYGDPLSCARRWLDAGAEALHVVNLDGAFGESEKNADLIRALVKDTGVEIEPGGGIRSVDDGRRWLGTGVSRIILSTFAIKEPESIRTLAQEFGSDRVMAGVDARGGQVTIHGWQETAVIISAGQKHSRVSAQVPCSTRTWTSRDCKKALQPAGSGDSSGASISRWSLPAACRRVLMSPHCGRRGVRGGARLGAVQRKD